MIAFLPIARYRVEYQVASGRPFSSFERLLLRAVRDGYGGVDTLSELFAVHRRLIVEGLVTLMQAGWVSIGTGETSFVLTSSGRIACDGDTLPPTIALSDRSLTIVVEKVTGQVARNNEIDFHSRSNLRNLWQGGVQLRKGDVSNIVDPAQVSPLLTHQATEWIRWIGPITVINDNAAFAVIDVDTSNERMLGIPNRWTPLLLPECLEAVRRRESELADNGASVPDDLERELRQLVRADPITRYSDEVSEEDLVWSPLEIRADDVIWSVDEHKKAISTMVREAATYIAIACPYFDDHAALELIPMLTSSLDRGLLINIFLGKFPPNSDVKSRAAVEKLKKLEYDSSHGTGTGRLSLGTRATSCNTYIVLADTELGASAILGTYPWGASLSLNDQANLSMHLHAPWAVARLCEVLDGFSSADEKLRLEAGFVRLRKVAGDLRKFKTPNSQVSIAGTRFKGEILLDPDHQAVISSLVSEAKRSITIFTDDLIAFSQCGWLELLTDVSDRLDQGIQVTYSATVDVKVSEAPDLEALMKMGARLNKRSGLAGTIMIFDDDSMILTNAKSNTGSARHSYSARIGIAMRGKGLWTELIDPSLDRSDEHA